MMSCCYKRQRRCQGGCGGYRQNCRQYQLGQGQNGGYYQNTSNCGCRQNLQEEAWISPNYSCANEWRFCKSNGPFSWQGQDCTGCDQNYF